MDDYLFHHNANTHWRYPTSEETDALIAASREALADFLNGRADEIVFGQNMTTLTFHLARALGREWSAGDEIVVTELDHHGNVAPWRALEKDRGVTVRTVKMRTEDGRLDWSSLEAAITPRTQARSPSAPRPTRSARSPTSRAPTTLAHAVGARVFVDAVHYAPHVLVDVAGARLRLPRLLGVQVLRPAHRHPVGQARADRSARRAAARAGAAGIAGAPRDGNAEPRRHRRRRGGGRFPRVARRRVDAAHAARRAARDLHRRCTRAASSCFAKLWNGLAAIDGRDALRAQARDAAHADARRSRSRGHSTDDVAIALAKRGVFVSNGDFYAATVIERLGVAAARARARRLQLLHDARAR